MSPRIYIIAVAMALAFPLSVTAGECAVTSNQATGAGSLSEALQKASRGDCVSTLESASRKRYETYVPVTATVHVIRISKSGAIAITDTLPELHGVGHDTLVITAASGAKVQLSGKSYSHPVPAVTLNGGDGNIILDGVGFEGFAKTAVALTGHHHLLIGATLAQNGSITHPAIRLAGAHNVVAECQIRQGAGDGIRVDAGATPIHAAVRKTEIAHNQGVGIRIFSPGAIISDNDIHHNVGAAIVVKERAEMRRNQVHHNADGILITESPLVPPVDLVDVSTKTAASYRLIGNIGRNVTAGYPWDDAHLDLQRSEIEIFLTDHAASRQGATFIAKATVVDVAKRLFVIEIPKPVMVNGKAIDHPIFVATLTDPEHRNTSRYSDPLDVEATRDWDQDGIPNDVEDALKINPRLKDSDGDGLTDGEEQLHKTGYEEMLQNAGKFLINDHVVSAKIPFKDLSHLDPTRADSDEDCLVDGLELGVAIFEWPAPAKAEYSILAQPVPVLSGACIGILKLHKIDPTTIKFHDSDPSTTTDPTHRDSDSDQLMDGAEDWNLNGARDTGETDLLNSDSDKDGLKDSDEDKNGNSIIDADESSPLDSDSDHDGVPDAQEVKSGGNPTHCDSDGDKLPDGIENNVSNQHPTEGCEGSPFHGTNFANPAALSSHKADSDGDGLKDGDEDKNHNGWLDPDESDPSVPDTDGDGISDYIEITGDVNHDGAADFFLGDIHSGSKCAPPSSIADLDCDGESNAQDSDSDNDGCPDRTEGMDPGNDLHGIPAAYNSDLKQCGSSGGGGSGGGMTGGGSSGGSAKPVADEAASETPAWNAYWAGRTDGGGNCSLIRGAKSPDFSVFSLAAVLLAMVVSARGFSQKKP